MQAVDDPDRRAYNTNPKWPVPLEFIEWQPSYTQEVRFFRFLLTICGASQLPLVHDCHA